MRSRIEDVAAAAGVSMKTVSRVLNNEPNVRSETRDRVMQAVELLQYKPNLSARSLAGQRSYAVALVYNNPSRNYLMEIQGGMLEACHANHYNLILGPVGSGKHTAGDIKGLFENFGPDGVVLIPPLTDDGVVLSYLEERGVPFACIAPRDPRGRIGVMMDETSAVLELMAGLIELGHRRIGHIKGPRAHGACQWRHAGYREALRKAGIAYDPQLVASGQFSFESGMAGANALLDLPDPPTAIFAANDDMAAGVIRAAGERGIAVPRQLSVCGFDDTPIARHIYPALTTVRQPTAEMGRLATLELLERIRSPGAGRMVRVEHTLLFRESTRPPRRR
ncbi:LacI family DNA-binding transcriptional regulator [Flavobacterium sp. MXW15]|uniref:LacI family DNA-binding transcriptional regulator n=1 Tax=Xanthomonas chitinilytica TaxID=2989819 RepID=A0ABT3K1A8_9XANT|nr:LacI family DNA-binding transcriptional regulator [Xanthomonas sp. H13-6]MCW4456602.1 LacI family DNA-binding transcriptional regulator [Flavobacterium sp. MXW15]MCW4474304.1 LacI family DNA-binding transcriptional regulator [Xanthomonas sp. H13-6]